MRPKTACFSREGGIPSHPPWFKRGVVCITIRLLLFYYPLVSVVWLFFGTINLHPMHRAQVAVLLGSS